MIAERPIFLLGLGAQKAGTSWLHDHLADHPQVVFGPMKEFHIFDALHLPDMHYFRDLRDINPIREPIRLLRVLVRTGRLPNRHHALRKKLLSSPERYADFFAQLVAERRSLRLTGDLTPEHGALSNDVLFGIRRQMVDRGFDVRAILIMRDPVERCISASRMYLGRALVPRNARDYAERGLITSREEHPFTEHAEIRTRYDRTLAEAEAVFAPNELFTAFYEELFSEGEIRRLWDWLGMTYVSADFDRRINESSTAKKTVDPSLKAAIADHYRPVYEDMFQRFGEDRIRAIWPSAELLD